MKVKICGLTNLADALAAAESGADYLGFIFYPKSPRVITSDVCAPIVRAVRAAHPALRCVGVFVNEPSEYILSVLNTCDLDLAQLHGDESPEIIAAFQGRAYKAFRSIGDHHTEFAPRGFGEPAFLVDAAVTGAYGGTGKTADWTAAQALAAHYPMFLAGGLTPDNVAEAIAQVRPWGVDVASGVEQQPGKKDHTKVRAFIRAAKSVHL